MLASLRHDELFRCGQSSAVDALRLASVALDNHFPSSLEALNAAESASTSDPAYLTPSRYECLPINSTSCASDLRHFPKSDDQDLKNVAS